MLSYSSINSAPRATANLYHTSKCGGGGIPYLRRYSATASWNVFDWRAFVDRNCRSAFFASSAIGCSWLDPGDVSDNWTWKADLDDSIGCSVRRNASTAKTATAHTNRLFLGWVNTKDSPATRASWPVVNWSVNQVLTVPRGNRQYHLHDNADLPRLLTAASNLLLRSGSPTLSPREDEGGGDGQESIIQRLL